MLDKVNQGLSSIRDIGSDALLVIKVSYCSRVIPEDPSSSRCCLAEQIERLVQLEHPWPCLLDDELVSLINLELNLYRELQIIWVTFVELGELAMNGPEMLAELGDVPVA